MKDDVCTSTQILNELLIGTASCLWCQAICKHGPWLHLVKTNDVSIELRHETNPGCTREDHYRGTCKSL